MPKVDDIERIAEHLDFMLNRGREIKARGFVLMVFDYFGDDTRDCEYISNGAEWDAIVALLKTQIARSEAKRQ
jgi:hypothetical protein